MALAPFLGKSALKGIFGRDLLDDPSQLRGFAALCGLGEHKPFECVGEIAESAAVMARLGDHPDWRDDAVVRQLLDAFPLLRQNHRERILKDLNLYLRDNTQAWILGADGSYTRSQPGSEPPVSAQEELLQQFAAGPGISL